MKNFTSRTIKIQKSASEIFEKLSDFNNFKDMIPADKVEDFDCTATTCSFTVKGLQNVDIKIKELVSNKKVVYETVDGKPVEMTFGFDVFEISDNNSEVKINVNLQAEGLMSNIISRPINNMLKIVADKLESSF
jgi:carbon monoxide dehydrogenase subunit G